MGSAFKSASYEVLVFKVLYSSPYFCFLMYARWLKDIVLKSTLIYVHSTSVAGIWPPQPLFYFPKWSGQNVLELRKELKFELFVLSEVFGRACTVNVAAFKIIHSPMYFTVC